MLNARQFALYHFLKERGNQWTKQEDVAYALFDWYPIYGGENFHNCTARTIMTNDIRAINNSDLVDEVIISGNLGVKLATEEEFDNCIRREYRAVFNKLKRIRKKERKGKLNGQARLVFKTEREVIEAFLHTD